MNDFSGFRQPAVPGLLSVVVPVGRDPEGLRRTLASLRAAQVPPGGVEIVVGNDGADTAASAVAADYAAKEVAISPNAGSYGARNRALEQTRGERIGFVDADAMVNPGWMMSGLAALDEADYACGAITVPEHCGTSPGRILDWLSAFPVEQHLRSSLFGPTANLFVRRTLIERLGAFDGRLRSGGDVEFGRRVNEAGSFRQVYWPQAIVYHMPRTYRQQLAKVLRVTRGQYDLGRYHPNRFPEFRLNPLTMLRNLLPPGRLSFLSHPLSDLGPRGDRLAPLFYLMLWSFKLQRLRAQIEVAAAAGAAATAREPARDDSAHAAP